MKRIFLAFWALFSAYSFASAQDDKPSPINDKLFTIKTIQLAPGHAFLGDVDSGIRADYPPGTNPTFDMRHNVFTDVTVGEIDFRFDKLDAVGVRYGWYNGTGFVLDSNSSGGTTYIYSSLYLNGAEVYSLDYYRFIPDHYGRWYGAFSADYYSNVGVWFQYGCNNGAVTATQDANLSGDGIGFTLGFGRELALGSFIGLDACVQFRYANIPKVTSVYPYGSRTETLVKASNGALAMVDVQAVGQGGLQYAAVDLSGIYGMFSLNIYPY